MKNGKNKYVLVKKVIVHATTVKITVTKINMHLWHICLAMMNVHFGDSLQLTNWILDSGATCQMTPEVSDFIQGSLEDTDKYIEVADRHHVT